MAEKLLSSKTAAEKKKELQALSKATGTNYLTPTPLSDGGRWISDTPSKNILNGATLKNVTPSNFFSVSTTPLGSNNSTYRPANHQAEQEKQDRTESYQRQDNVLSKSGARGGVTPPNTTISETNPLVPERSRGSSLPQKTPGRAQTLESGQVGTEQPVQDMTEIQPMVEPKSFESRVNEVGKKFFDSLGAHQEFVKSQIADYETQTGKQVAVNSRAFQAQLKSVLGNQNRWGEIFQRFAHSPDYFTTSTPQESSKARTEASIAKPMVAASMSPEEQIASVLNDSGSDTLHSQLEQILSMPPETPGETLIRNQLMLQLGAIDQGDINELLDRQEVRAIKAYKTGLDMVEKSKEELEKAIDGTLTEPETGTGLLAKVYAEGKEEVLAEVSAEKSYQTQRHDIIMNDLREKRADLVGYTKAKLHAMGAEDSSAGVALLGKIVSEADMQITLAELDFNEGVRQLDSEAKSTIRSFTNKIAELVIGQNEKEDSLAADYTDTLNTIEDNKFLNDRERRKLTLEAYSDYLGNVSNYRARVEEQKQAELEAAYDRMVDARDYAIKMSGVTGTMFIPGENGELIDTGIATFSARKYQDESMQSWARMEIDMSQERRLAAKSILDTYGSAGAGYAEQMLGLPSGSLAGLSTVDEMKYALDVLQENNAMARFYAQQEADAANGSALMKYYDEGAGIKSGGIGINPFTLPDVRDTIMGLSSVTQSWKPSGTGGTDIGGGHGGVDYVSKDGYSRAVRGGTVVEITPWDGNSGWGNQVRVMDDQGVVWQYSHLGDRDVAGDNPFSVQVGQTVSAGEILGREGNTGRVYSQYSGKLAGRHTDLRIVGKMEVPDNNALVDQFVIDTGKVPTAAQKDAILKGGQEAYDALTKPKVKSPESEPSWMVNNWLGDLSPDLQNLFPDKKVTLADLKEKYAAVLKKYPTGGDLKMLEEMGLKGLQTILEREAEKEKTTGGTNIQLTSE